MNTVRSCISLVAVSLAACGGGGGSFVPGEGDDGSNLGPINEESPGGIWGGTISSNVTPEVFAVLGVITEAGEARFITGSGTQIFGAVSTAGSVLSGALTGVTAPGFVWPDNTVVADIAVDGLVTERASIDGDYEGGGDSGSFSLLFDPIYDRDSSLASVEGTWVEFDAFLNIVSTFVVEADGAVNGTDVAGCVYTGAISIIDPEYNVYDIVVDVANCLVPSLVYNGSYSGVGVLSDEEVDSGANDVLTFGVNSDFVVITNVLFKL